GARAAVRGALPRADRQPGADGGNAARGDRRVRDDLAGADEAARVRAPGVCGGYQRTAAWGLFAADAGAEHADLAPPPLLRAGAEPRRGGANASPARRSGAGAVRALHPEPARLPRAYALGARREAAGRESEYGEPRVRAPLRRAHLQHRVPL